MLMVIQSELIMHAEWLHCNLNPKHSPYPWYWCHLSTQWYWIRMQRHTHTHTHAYKLRHINTLATVQCIVLKLLPDHPLIEDQSKHVTTDVKLSIGRLKWTETEITLYSPKAWLIIEFNRQFKLIQDNKIRI